MTVRFKLALTIFATGLVTALLVIATIVYSLQRFENETAYRRGMGFLMRVVSMYDNIFDMHDRSPEEFQRWLRGLVLFEPDSELYLLDLERHGAGQDRAGTLKPSLHVALGPVRESIERADADYVMGDDPERMDAGAVVVASVVKRTMGPGQSAPAGYLYLVLHTQQLPEGRWDVLRSSFTRPVLGLTAAVVALTTLLAALIIASVTEPLRRLTQAVSTLSQRGLAEGLTIAPGQPVATSPPTTSSASSPAPSRCCSRSAAGSGTRCAAPITSAARASATSRTTCARRSPPPWPASRRSKAAGPRRPNVPTTAGWPRSRLRNSRNAARMVQSLGDLAKLDEPEFSLRFEAVDVSEMLDDIALRFAERAGRQGVALRSGRGPADTGDTAADRPVAARLDIELFERAVANLVDNALKFCSAGHTVTLAAALRSDGSVVVSVADDGPGIPAADLPQLFDRFYQSRQTVAPATGDGGRGLGLAIVKRIAELHGGDVAIESSLGQGTRVVLTLPPMAEA